MFYRLRRVWRAAHKALKMPMTRLHSFNWFPEDHAHICLAARLLEPDDFREVCPLAHRKWIEHEDQCDECGYFARVDFDSDPFGGHKHISIYTKGEWQP